MRSAVGAALLLAESLVFAVLLHPRCRFRGYPARHSDLKPATIPE